MFLKLKTKVMSTELLTTLLMFNQVRTQCTMHMSILCSLLADGFFSKGHLDARAYTSV